MNNKTKIEKAQKYFNMGLNSKEISKLIDIPYRTIQNWIYNGKWVEWRKITDYRQKAQTMQQKGYTTKQIAKYFGVKIGTAYKWLQKNK